MNASRATSGAYRGGVSTSKGTWSRKSFRLTPTRTARVISAKTEVERLAHDRADERCRDQPTELRRDELDCRLRGQASRGTSDEPRAGVGRPLQPWRTTSIAAAIRAPGRRASKPPPTIAAASGPNRTAARSAGRIAIDVSIVFVIRRLLRSATAAAARERKDAQRSLERVSSGEERYRCEQRGRDDSGYVDDSPCLAVGDQPDGRLALSLERGIPCACRQFPIEESSPMCWAIKNW